MTATINEHPTNHPSARSKENSAGAVDPGTIHNESITDNNATPTAEKACPGHDVEAGTRSWARIRNAVPAWPPGTG